jgi:hypothetical protein
MKSSTRGQRGAIAVLLALIIAAVIIVYAIYEFTVKDQGQATGTETPKTLMDTIPETIKGGSTKRIPAELRAPEQPQETQ